MNTSAFFIQILESGIKSILTKMVIVLIVPAPSNTLIATHVSTPALSQSDKLIYIIMDNIHAKQRTTNHPDQHELLTML